MDTGKMCQFYGIITSFVLGIEHRNIRIHAKWMSRLASKGVDTTSKQAIDRYLGRRRVRGGMEGSNLLWEFIFIINGVRAYDDEGWEM